MMVVAFNIMAGMVTPFNCEANDFDSDSAVCIVSA